ncbi:hypothetical protein Gorai_004759, partial [Gossypium raimondii]|nr:hypothetical protein [Gossypium raimondii]
MLDPTIPLTTSEWEEWGDPRKEEFYFYMKSYSPVDNVKAQNYPDILVTAGLHGKFERLQEDAMTYTFMLKALNMIPASGS